MNKALLIVDPQNDFINGSLPVGGAAEAMDALANYVSQHSDEYRLIMYTMDSHPDNHLSFDCNGGQWPKHCVLQTEGYQVWEPLRIQLSGLSDRVYVLPKGNDPEREEYSVFENAPSRLGLTTLVDSADIDQIDICGIAGDICVLNTLKDGVALYGPERFNVLLPYCPSLDGGNALRAYIAERGIPHID